MAARAGTAAGTAGSAGTVDVLLVRRFVVLGQRQVHDLAPQSAVANPAPLPNAFAAVPTPFVGGEFKILQPLPMQQHGQGDDVIRGDVQRSITMDIYGTHRGGKGEGGGEVSVHFFPDDNFFS